MPTANSARPKLPREQLPDEITKMAPRNFGGSSESTSEIIFSENGRCCPKRGGAIPPRSMGSAPQAVLCNQLQLSLTNCQSAARGARIRPKRRPAGDTDHHEARRIAQPRPSSCRANTERCLAGTTFWIRCHRDAKFGHRFVQSSSLSHRPGFWKSP